MAVSGSEAIPNMCLSSEACTYSSHRVHEALVVTNCLHLYIAVPGWVGGLKGEDMCVRVV